MFHVVSREFQLEQPKPSVTCQHGVDQRTCDSKVEHLPYLMKFCRPSSVSCVNIYSQKRRLCQFCVVRSLPWTLPNIRRVEVYHDSAIGGWSPGFHR